MSNSVVGKINRTSQDDIAAARSVGAEYEKASTAYLNAVKYGDKADVAEAQKKRDEAQEKFAALMATQKQEHDMMMQLIQMIGR